MSGYVIGVLYRFSLCVRKTREREGWQRRSRRGKEVFFFFFSVTACSPTFTLLRLPIPPVPPAASPLSSAMASTLRVSPPAGPCSLLLLRKGQCEREPRPRAAQDRSSFLALWLCSACSGCLALCQGPCGATLEVDSAPSLPSAHPLRRCSAALSTPCGTARVLASTRTRANASRDGREGDERANERRGVDRHLLPPLAFFFLTRSLLRSSLFQSKTV